MPMIAKERLYLTADKSKLVRTGERGAATLYCTPGTQIPDSAAERFGLVDGALPDGETKEDKQPKPNKEKAPGEDKGGKTAAQPADPTLLTSVKGIGAPTAAKLVAAGIADTAALAAIDPAAAPAIAGLPPRFDWAAVVATAKSLQPAQA